MTEHDQCPETLQSLSECCQTRPLFLKHRMVNYNTVTHAIFKSTGIPITLQDQQANKDKLSLESSFQSLIFKHIFKKLFNEFLKSLIETLTC